MNEFRQYLQDLRRLSEEVKSPPPPAQPVATQELHGGESLVTETPPQEELSRPPGHQKIQPGKILEYTPSVEAKAKVEAIEAEALTKGWTKEQLWSTTGWLNTQGLVCFLDRGKTVTDITPDYIEIAHPPLPTGETAVTRLYHQRREHPWLRFVQSQEPPEATEK